MTNRERRLLALLVVLVILSFANLMVSIWKALT